MAIISFLAVILIGAAIIAYVSDISSDDDDQV